MEKPSGIDQGFFGAVDLERRSLWINQRALPLEEGKSPHVVQMSVRKEQQPEILGEHVELRSMTEDTVD